MSSDILPGGWDKEVFSNAIDINRQYKIVKGKPSKFVEMKSLSRNKRKIEFSEIKNFSSGPRFMAGDTLFAKMKGCLANGKIAYCDILDPDEIGFGSTEFLVLSEVKNKTDKLFIYYFCRYAPIVRFALANMNGTGRERIPKEALDKLHINLPPLREQKRIANLLGYFDDKIEINNEVNKCLERLIQARFDNWFVYFEPFLSEKLKKSNIGDIPKDWSVKKLSDIAKIVTGKTPSTKEKDNYGDKYKFVTIRDIHNKVYAVNTERYISEKGHQEVSSSTIPPNSLAVSCIATVGLVSIIPDESHTNQQINSILCKENILFYLYSFFSSSTDMLKKLGSGGTVALNINKKSFEDIKILLPSEEVLNEYLICVKPLFKKIRNNCYENQCLEVMRDSLLPKLMSGEIRV